MKFWSSRARPGTDRRTGGDAGMILLEDADETALHDCSYDGGYVYGTSHSVMPGARPEKYRIMIEELRAGSHYTFIHQGSRQTMQSLIDVIR